MWPFEVLDRENGVGKGGKGRGEEGLWEQQPDPNEEAKRAREMRRDAPGESKESRIWFPLPRRAGAGPTPPRFDKSINIRLAKNEPFSNRPRSTVTR